MFSPVQIKHECTTVEDVNTSNGAVDNSIYPIFINRDIEHVSHQLWMETQLSNEIPVKTEVYNQEAMFQMQEHESLSYMKEYVQNDIFYTINQEHSDDQMQTNNLCHQNTNSAVVIQENKQTPLLQDLQNIESINQTLPSKSSTSTKSNPLERLSPKNATDSNMGKKLKYKCEICSKEFGHKSNLFIHMRTHNGERPYKCNQCDKCFTHSGNLAIHMRTHSGERPYACQICGKMFSHSGNLSTHLRTHSGVKPYKCSVCSKEFRHSGNLSIHERIHSGVKPFQCKICGKEFYHSGNLTTHMKKHPVNMTDCKSEQRSVQYAGEGVNTSSSDVSLNDIKSRHSNVVPTKQESTGDMVLDTVGILSS